MTSKYVQPGKVLQYTASSAIAAGDVVVVGKILGVALTDIANGATGSVAIDGVFTLPKVTTAVIPQGSHLLWDVSAGKFDVGTATAATGDVSGPPAVAFEAAGNGATTLAVKLTGVPGTVT